NLYLQDESGRFKASGPISADGMVIQVAGPASPSMADWNEDGILDLLLGDGNGEVYWYEGAAAEGRYEFAAPISFQIADVQDVPRRNAAPFVVDWNGDSRNDLLIGGDNGEVHVYLQDERRQLSDSG